MQDELCAGVGAAHRLRDEFEAGLEIDREFLVVDALDLHIEVAERLLGVTPAALQDAVLGAITKTAADEEAAGRLTATTALALRTLIEIVPPDQLLAAVKSTRGACAKLPWKSVGDVKQIAAEIGVKTGLAAACALNVAPLEAISALAYPQGLQGSEIDQRATLVDAFSERSRTRVRFPAPPLKTLALRGGFFCSSIFPPGLGDSSRCNSQCCRGCGRQHCNLRRPTRT